MSSEQESKLNAIVGAALKGIVEAGADDEFVGAFAARHREKVAQQLGMSATPRSEAPDLLAIVGDAVRAALADAGLVKRTAQSRRVYVTVAGRRTSLTLGRDLLARLEQAKGSEEARLLVQQLANGAPSTPNRSGWVEERLVAAMRAEAAPAPGAPRH